MKWLRLLRKKITSKNIFEKYYSTGELWVCGPMLTGGIRHGFWRYFHKNGKIVNSGYYKKGLFYGKWKEYNQKGKKIKETIYIR